MPNREKVIKGLESCRYGCPGDECPYHEGIKCADLMKDALELLKEQEHKDRMFHALEDDWKLLNELMKEQEAVVRCKYCKHGQYEEWNNGECVDKTVYCDGYGIHKPDWYCADGERREVCTPLHIDP